MSNPKKKKHVQNAEAKKASQDSSQAVPQEQPQETIAPAMPFDLSKVDPKKIQLAEKMGIPIKQLIGWAASVELRFAAIMEKLESAPEDVVKVLKAEALKRQTEIAQEMQQRGINPQQGSGGIGALAPILSALSGGGGGIDKEMTDIMKSMFRLNMDRMKQDMTNSMVSAKADAELSGALKNALAKEFAKKTAAKLLE